VHDRAFPLTAAVDPFDPALTVRRFFQLRKVDSDRSTGCHLALPDGFLLETRTVGSFFARSSRSDHLTRITRFFLTPFLVPTLPPSLNSDILLRTLFFFSSAPSLGPEPNLGFSPSRRARFPDFSTGPLLEITFSLNSLGVLLGMSSRNQEDAN